MSDTTQPDPGKHRVRIVLTACQAVEIYNQKPKSAEQCDLPRFSGLSVVIAEKYGVSPKTIRDIWNRRTWVFATKHLYTETEFRYDSAIIRKVIISSRITGLTGSN